VFWGVADADAAYQRLLERGAKAHSPVKEVGGGIKVATVLDPFGNIIGIIENPHFQLPS
jgi:predicted enzyme related to lactoylglutathione lyase